MMDVITTHINADFDSLASMVAAQKLYPKAKLVFPGSQEENLRQFLAISNYKITHYRPKQLDMNQIKRLILVDTRLAERIGSLAQVVGKPGVEIHIYDHHPGHPQDLTGQVEVLRETGATTTLLVELLQQREIQVSAAEATILALGIYEDTGLLTYTSTTPADLRAAAQVRAWGADLKAISSFINRDLSAQQISLVNELIKQAESYMLNGVEVVISSISIDKYTGDIALLAHKLRDIEKINVLFVLVRLQGRVHMVARSNSGQVNVGEVALELGGGGHPTAASATVKKLTLSQTKDKLLEILERQITPYRTAQHFMTIQAKEISIQQTVEQAREAFMRYGTNHLPVVDAQGKLAGIISRQTVDKAISHHMGDSLVAECMVSDISWVTPQTELTMVRELMLERHQPLLPVVGDGRLLGVVTRSDLLRMLHEDSKSGLPPIYHRRDAPGYQKNLTSLLRERLPERVQQALKVVGTVADELGYSVYVVGGMVRDLLLRVDNLDVDIVVEQDGIRFARTLAKTVAGRCKAHQKFATAVVVFPDGFKLDVATARTEYYKHPAALPIVEQSSIKQDLYRRDFSINSLAIQLNQQGFGRLIDFFGGQQDLKNGVIRVLHSLSFVEDPSRVFRAIRFEQRFGFRIGKYTLNLIQHTVQRHICDKLAGSRLWQELVMIFAEAQAAKSIMRMGELNLLQVIHPRLKLNNELIQLCHNIRMVIDWYSLLFLKHQIENWLVCLLCLTDQLSDDEADQVWQRLILGQRHISLLNRARQTAPAILHKLHRGHGPKGYKPKRNKLTPSQIFRLLQGASPEALLYVMAKTPSEEVKRVISFYLTKLQQETPEIGGQDLKELGFKPGPQFKQILDAVLDAKLDGKLGSRTQGRQAELEFVRTIFGSGGE